MNAVKQFAATGIRSFVDFVEESYYGIDNKGEVRMSETIITIIILGAAAVACIIGLIVINVREKKMKEKPIYYSAVGNWLSGKRR